MKKTIKSIIGVTLLEIMLVLAVASLIIIMSIRYYQSAQTSAAVQDLQNALASMIATADNIGLSSGTYTGLTQQTLVANLPASMISSASAGTIKSPWGDIGLVIGVTGTPPGSAYTATYTMPGPTPAAACFSLVGFVNNIAKQHLSTPASTSNCPGSFSYTYSLSATS